MRSSLESIESPLDVVVQFSEEEWTRARRDLDWATSLVIEELGKYKSKPEEYFATKPDWIARLIPWRKRIRMEIKGHIWTNDRDIRFSEWWIVKIIR